MVELSLTLATLAKDDFVLKMTIEEALAWAYLDELPKASAPGRLKGPRMATPGWVKAAETWAARIDISNDYGLVPDFRPALPPHPAARALHELLGCLDDVAFAAEALEPFGDWVAEAGKEERDLLGVAAARAQARHLRPIEGGALQPRRDLAPLLRRCALLGPPDGWRCAARPAVRAVLSKHGQQKWFRMVRRAVRFDERGRPIDFATVESDDGWCQRSKRPFKDAYPKMCLSPDPASLADSRVEWMIWRLALDVVAEMAKDAVFTFDGQKRVSIDGMGVEILPSALPNQPWISAEAHLIRPLIRRDRAE